MAAISEFLLQNVKFNGHNFNHKQCQCELDTYENDIDTILHNFQIEMLSKHPYLSSFKHDPVLHSRLVIIKLKAICFFKYDTYISLCSC